MKKRGIFILTGCIIIIIVLNLNVKTKRTTNKLMLRNIEALAKNESMGPKECKYAGGFCFKDGTIYKGISLIP